MKKILIAFILLTSSFYLEAQHQVGGYISLQWVSGYTYQVTIEEYSIGDPQNSGACGPVYDLDTIRLRFGDGNSALLNRSNGTGDSVCICRKLNTYTTTHTYPRPGVYHLWFDVQDRGPNICNATNSVNTDMYIYNVLIIPPTGGATLPVITNPPACGYACTSQCYYYNPEVSVPAGDSVSYSLGKLMQLNPVDTTGEIVGGYYNPGAVINADTGEFAWCKPTSNCFWNFAILITTYNSQKLPIDTQEVEMQVNVQNDCSLGLNELKTKNEEVRVYPNPSGGIFNLQIRNYELGMNTNVEVYNELGQQVYSQFLPASSGTQFVINLSSQPNGIYLYRVIDDNGGLIGEGKLVIQK